MLAGIALAGGRSSRMGKDKSLLSIPDTDLTLLSHCQKLLAGLQPIKVWISGIKDNQALVDVYPNYGPMSGIHSVLSYLINNEPDITEVLFVPVDMPALTLEDLQLLVQQGQKFNSLCYYQDHHFPLYMPIRKNILSHLEQQLQHAVELPSQGKNKQLSMRKVLNHFAAKSIPVTNQSSLININTPQQWQQHCELSKVKGK
ncbi:molybdenum cofactor guanylyltransferase [Paraglaciecola sp. L3A3]|uniref:molybdenum cofactor guanylyltransferase n=1 Tax=Paraglaciecola sp. L3A3 TaxID=2686358 RepID=UPI00131BF5A6|nr:molybdenum cofactor guanylyltransferase [Paraglaciecola sp. L3A3]